MAIPIPDPVSGAIYAGPWWRHRGVLLLNLYLLLPLLTGCINGYDSSLVNGLQMLPAWQNQFKSPRGMTLGAITSAQMIGSLAGLPFTPFCSDRFGRRATLVVGAILMLGGVALQAIASTIGRFIGARALVGAGLIFGMNGAPLLITELAYPTQRGKITALYNTMWYGGSIVAAWTCLVAYITASNSIWSWRAPVLVQASGPLLQLSLIWFLPESPRWLISKGSEKKALRILARFHAIGLDERDPFVQYEMEQIRYALRMEKELNKNSSFTSLFATPGNRKRMWIILAIAVFSQWSGNGLVLYYINLVLDGVDITSIKTKATISGCLQIWNLVAALTGALLIDKLGRRTLFIISNAGMLITFSIWALTTSLYYTAVTASKEPANATIPLIFVFCLFYDLAYTPMLVAYTLEILPYSIRAKGFALMNFAVSIAQAFNQFVDPWAFKAMGWKYYLVYCGWLGFELFFVIIFIVETRGRTLEETAALFDGEYEPETLAHIAKANAVVSLRRVSRLTPVEDYDDDDYIYSANPRTVESYGLRRPQFVFERDRVGLGHTRSRLSRGGAFSFVEKI